MQQRTISFALFIYCALALVAQEDVKVNSLSLNWGMGELMRQDLTFSPFVPKGWSPINVQLAYERSQKIESRDGVYDEGTGMPPDIYVKNTSVEMEAGQDITLEAALGHF